ncbi:MAG: hypothetical protein FWD36_04085 [Treponema sp.]|nr:hypothetical protein [Treponema sp.]
MRKLSVMAVMVAALVLVTCSEFTAPVEIEQAETEARVVVTENGQTFVKLGIGVSNNSRALFQELAEVACERFEVAFANGANHYRTSWLDNERGYIWVQPGDYANNAILFAGTERRVLLAVGTMFTADDTDNTTVTANTRRITFELSSLGSDMTTGSFSISGTGVGTAAIPGGYSAITVPKGPQDRSGTFTVTGIPANARIVTAAPGNVIRKIISIPGYNRALDVGGSFSAPVHAIPNGTLVPVNGQFGITINTRANEGLVRLAFELPVYALSATHQLQNTIATDAGITLNDVGPRTWYIQGGIDNNALDTGEGEGSDGGAILLGVGQIATDQWIEIYHNF